MQSWNVMALKHFPTTLWGEFIFCQRIPHVIGHYHKTLFLLLSWTNCLNSPIAGDLRVLIWDAMTPHDVTTIYNLILILTM